jgi:ubiquitin carboxyl-terminal hydrolase L3
LSKTSFVMDASPTPGVYINSKGKKTFIPLENNPAVFEDLIQRLGVSSDLGFYDVYSLDEPALLAMVPRPVHALIFIAPAPVYNKVRQTYDGLKDADAEEDEFHETPTRFTYDQCGEDEPVIVFRQTIGHACGLYALIHAVGNGSAKQFIMKDSLIDTLLQEAVPLKRDDRAAVLYNSKQLEVAHMASAVKGDSVTPSSEEPVGYAFITFTKGKDGHLWELEGSWNPIDRGALGESEDLLGEKAVELGVGRYMKMADDNIELSIVALATKP